MAKLSWLLFAITTTMAASVNVAGKAKRTPDDVTACSTTNTVSYNSANELAQQIANAAAFTQRSGSSNAYQYAGAYATYCDNGFGPTIDSTSFGDAVYSILTSCWNGQQMSSNSDENGAYTGFIGDGTGFHVCLGSNPYSTPCGC
jgi:hypothetical protein